jgi:hypothetical protein
MLDLQFTLRILVDGKGVDDAYRAGLAQPFEFGDHLAVEVGSLNPRTISCTGPIAMVESSVQTGQPVQPIGALRPASVPG